LDKVEVGIWVEVCVTVVIRKNIWVRVFVRVEVGVRAWVTYG